MKRTFANTPRIKGEPFIERLGNHQLERNANGEVSMTYNWHLPHIQRVLAKMLETMNEGRSEHETP